MRLTILTHYFPPEVGAPQSRLSQLARGLSERGFAVTVHTCPPHYPFGSVVAPYGNGLWQEERHGAVRIVRSAVLPAPNRGTVRRLADHASFAVSALTTSGRTGPSDAVLVESPPLFLAAAGVAYAYRHGARLVLNVADLWPDSAVQLGAVTSATAIRAARTLERFAYRHAAAITVPTEGMAATLVGRSECAGKVNRMPPFVDTARFPMAPVERDGGALRVLYAGTTGLAQGLDVLLEAARRVGPEIATVRIAGGGAEASELRRRVDANRTGSVELLGVRPAAEIPELYRNSHAAVVLLRDVPLFRGALPTKLFEAMAAGRPLVLAAAGESAELVERAGIGVVVPPEDPARLADAVRRMAAAPEQELRAMGEAGRRVARAHDLPQALDRWDALLQRVARPRLGSRP